MKYAITCSGEERSIYELNRQEPRSALKRFQELCFILNDNNMKLTLSPTQVLELRGFAEQTVNSRLDALAFAQAYLIAVDQLFASLAEKSHAGLEPLIVYYEEDVGSVVVQLDDAKSFWREATHRSTDWRVARKKKDLFIRSIHSRLTNFDIIPAYYDSQVRYIVHELPHSPLRENWSEEGRSWTWAISQTHSQPVISFEPIVSQLGALFNVDHVSDKNEGFERIVQELERSFMNKADVVVFPEMVLNPEDELTLCAKLKGLSIEHNHDLLLFIGLLHQPQGAARCNKAKCYGPCSNDDGIFEYGPIFEHQKQEPFNLKAKDMQYLGITLPSELGATEAIENIHLGDSWHVMITPAGRMTMLICKDFITVDESMFHEASIDIAAVCALTPSACHQFLNKAKMLGEKHTATLVANNGYYAEKQSPLAVKPYSVAAFPLRKKGKLHVYDEIERVRGETATLIVMKLFDQGE